MNLQKRFVHSVRLYFKEQGEVWLQKLPTIIKFCEEKWSLKMEEPYSLSVNYVAPAVMADGREVVVKICIPGKEFLQEKEALRLLGQNKIVKLLDSDEDNGILILEKLSPGKSLADINDEEKACEIAAEVISNLVIPSESANFPTTCTREESLRQIVIKNPDGLGPIPVQVLEQALNVFVYLNHTKEHELLLHGDLHHDNIISSGDRKWTAIDPKGLIGEIEYDFIQFMLNQLPETGAFSIIKRRVDIFTEKLNLNKERLLLWGYCHSVLATSWSVDDDGNCKHSFFQGIEIFEKLYETEFGKIKSLHR
ncbi:aminoglycoside phosphotransferase family protein [Litchfieldia salsa]|uniref:Streptomycin 6-kinase n=1 Tax=Litchfieldia salsa TaxID=930152 RepID=A0A1H0PCW4_9BACI|nr:aminoglycoside phosphotransferase family protein [Litchfieldia salsa]SDP02843.1 streptomycin 6-kinase [Litchfieldia salsa]